MKLNDNYILREIAGEKVIVKQGTHGVDMTKIISFNESAAALWEQFFGKEFDSDQAAEFLIERYGISSEIAARDTGLWINKLMECGAISK